MNRKLKPPSKPADPRDRMINQTWPEIAGFMALWDDLWEMGEMTFEITTFTGRAATKSGAYARDMWIHSMHDIGHQGGAVALQVAREAGWDPSMPSGEAYEILFRAMDLRNASLHCGHVVCPGFRSVWHPGHIGFDGRSDISACSMV